MEPDWGGGRNPRGSTWPGIYLRISHLHHMGVSHSDFFSQQTQPGARDSELGVLRGYLRSGGGPSTVLIGVRALGTSSALYPPSC